MVEEGTDALFGLVVDDRHPQRGVVTPLGNQPTPRVSPATFPAHPGD